MKYKVSDIASLINSKFIGNDINICRSIKIGVNCNRAKNIENNMKIGTISELH